MSRTNKISFKQAQHLPTLSSELPVNTATRSERNFWPVKKPSLVSQCEPAQPASKSQPQPTTSVSVAEQVVFTIAALGASVAAGQAFMTMLSPAPGWPLLGNLVGALFS